MFVLTAVLCIHIVCTTRAQTCPVDIPDADRRDCHPWPGASQSACEARGCVWCNSQTPGIPWCFINDKVCPSTIPEQSRVDCLSEGGFRNDCLLKGCVWCETATTGQTLSIHINRCYRCHIFNSCHCFTRHTHFYNFILILFCSVQKCSVFRTMQDFANSQGLVRFCVCVSVSVFVFVCSFLACRSYFSENQKCEE